MKCTSICTRKSRVGTICFATVVTLAIGWYAALLTAKSTLSPSTNPNRRPVLYHKPTGGRFGNILFEFASTYGLARTTNHDPGFSAGFLKHLKTVFNLSLKPVEIPRGIKVINERFFGRFFPKRIPGSLGNKTNIAVNGFLQVRQYFMAYEKDLRRMLTIKPALIEKAQGMLNKTIREYFLEEDNSTKEGLSEFVSNATYVAIHVRVGDLLASGKNPKYRIASKSYIVKAMKYFKDRYSNVLFIACSDSQNWLEKRLISYPNVIILPATKDFRIHFTALTLCDHTIMTVGTFGWWAAWFAQGTTVYYNRPFKENGGLYKASNQSDMFLPQWIPMGD